LERVNEWVWDGNPYVNSSEDLVKFSMEEDQGVLGLRRCKGRISGFLDNRNRLAAPNWPPGATSKVHGVLFTKHVVFRTFRATGIVGR